DVFDAESLQTGVASLEDVFARKPTSVRTVGDWKEYLGGDHQLLATTVLPQRFAGHLLAGSERVHVGGVEEVDSGFDLAAEKRHGMGLRENRRARFGRAVADATEGQARYPQTGATQASVFHRDLPDINCIAAVTPPV